MLIVLHPSDIPIYGIPTMWPAPSYKLVYKPQKLYIVISTLNHSDWTYKRTNLAIVNGVPTLNVVKLVELKYLLPILEKNIGAILAQGPAPKPKVLPVFEDKYGVGWSQTIKVHTFRGYRRDI